MALLDFYFCLFSYTFGPRFISPIHFWWWSVSVWNHFLASSEYWKWSKRWKRTLRLWDAMEKILLLLKYDWKVLLATYLQCGIALNHAEGQKCKQAQTKLNVEIIVPINKIVEPFGIFPHKILNHGLHWPYDIWLTLKAATHMTGVTLGILIHGFTPFQNSGFISNFKGPNAAPAWALSDSGGLSNA